MDKGRKLLSDYLCKTVRPSEEELAAFLDKVSFHRIAKRKRLIQANSYCKRIYFVIDGFLKYVMNINDKDLVVHLATQGDLVADFYSYYSSNPAISSVYTITDCQLASIEREDLERLYASFKVWEKFGRLVAEQAALRLIFEKIKLQTQSTEEIYLNLMAEKPQLLQHVKLGDLAQTFGVSQETLSRIRRRIADNS